MSVRTLKKIAFHAIARQLKDTQRTQADIAADYNVSASTVSWINQTGNWGNYLANIRAAKPLRQRVKSPTTIAAASKVERARQAGLNPVTAEQRIEQRFADELDALAKVYATNDRVDEQVARLDNRVDIAREIAKRARDDVAAKADEPTERELVFNAIFSWGTLALAAVALIVAIVK